MDRDQLVKHQRSYFKILTRFLIRLSHAIFSKKLLKQKVFDANPKANNPPEFSVIYFHVIKK